MGSVVALKMSSAGVISLPTAPPTPKAASKAGADAAPHSLGVVWRRRGVAAVDEEARGICHVWKEAQHPVLVSRVGRIIWRRSFGVETW